MARRRIVFFGNCQAQALAGLCRRFLAPRHGDITSAITAPFNDPDAVRKELAAADVIVEQVFDHPLEINVIAENRGQEIIRFPNVYAIFYWPYTNQRHPRNDEIGTDYDAGPYPNEMGDSFLNRLITKGVSAEEALELYLAEDMSGRAERLFEMNADSQQKRDEATGLDVHSTIKRFFRTEHLFLTSAHPNMRIFSVVAAETMRRLGYEKRRIQDALAAQRVSPFPHLALPVHPRVIDHFKLRFAAAETRYPYFEEGDFTFAEYVLRYINFEWNPALREALAMAAGSDPDSALGKLDTAIAASPRSATALRLKCEFLIRKRHYDAAAAAATQAAELGPADPKNWLSLCRAYRFAQQFERAQEAFGRAKVIAPVDADVRGEASNLAAAQGLLVDAVEEAERAVDIEPGGSRFYLSLSELLTRAGQHDKAIEAARRIVELEPHISAYRLALADRLARNRQEEEAIGIISETIARDGDDPHAHGRLGHLFAQRGDLDRAETAFRRAFELAPSDSGIRLPLADLLDRKGNSAEAASLLSLLASAGSQDPHIHARLGHFLVRAGRGGEAVASARRAVELAPTVSHYRSALANALDGAGRHEEALDIMRALVAEGAADPHAHARLGYMLGRAGDMAAAESAYRQAVKLAPEQPGFRLALADVLDRKGETEAAAAIAKALATDGARDPHVYARLGYFLLRLKDFAAAEAAVRRAIELAPDAPHYRIQLADIVNDSGRTAEAAELLRAYAAQGSGDHTLHRRLGQFLVALGDLDGAAAAFGKAIEISPEDAAAQHGLAEIEARRQKTTVGRQNNLPKEADNPLQAEPSGLDNAVVTPVPKKEEITGRAQSIRLEEGLHVLSVARSGMAVRVVDGLALPSTQVVPGYESRNSVTIVANGGGSAGWLGAGGGTVVISVGKGGGTVIATTYGATDDAALPAVQAIDLDRLPAAAAAAAPAVEEPPAEILLGREIAGELVLHIERQGDRRFSAGDWAGHPGDRLRIEGFAIRPLEGISPGQIEYMGFRPGGQQTSWVTDVKLCGTRGRGFPLTGFAVRLAPALRDRFDVVYEGYFFESGVKGPLRNGEPCRPSVVDDPLSAIRVRVVERTGA